MASATITKGACDAGFLCLDGAYAVYRCRGDFGRCFGYFLGRVFYQMKKRNRPTYTLLDEIAASPTTPIANKIRISQLTRMWDGLASIETNPNPSTNDWRVLSDAVNLMESLVDMGEIEDGSGLLMDAVAALAEAGKRHMQYGNPIRLDAKGIQAVRAVLEDYAYVLEHLPARTMIRCHRATEKRIREILAGKKKPHDIEVLAL